MNKAKFKIVEVNNGLCQITYKTKNSLNQTILYCLQDNGKNQGGIRLLRCSQDYEPQNNAKLNPGVFARDLFEKPTGDSKLENLCRLWIEEN